MLSTKTCILSCYDPRCLAYTIKRMTHLGIGHVDPIFLPNPIFILADPEHPRDRELILLSMGISIEHHGIKLIELHDHEDCAYRQNRLNHKFTAVDRNEEEHIIIKTLSDAENVIQDKYPTSKYEYEVRKFIVKRNSDDARRWEEKQI